MQKLLIVGATSLVALSGCSKKIEKSGFMQVSSSSENAQIDVELSDESNKTVYVEGIGGVAFVTGQKAVGSKEKIVGYAAVMPDPEVGAPLRERATYTAEYKAKSITDIEDILSFQIGWPTNYSGQIDLTADFASKTVTGEDGELVVNGTFNSGELAGTVIFDGLSAELTGELGSGAIVGAFQGNSSSQVVVGGFVGSAN